MLAWNLTEHNLCVVLNGKAHTVPRATDQFETVMDAISNDDENALDRLLNAKATVAAESAGRITFDGHNLYFNGEKVHNAIIDRLHFLWANNYPYKPLLRFMDNLMDNPSYRAVKELYGFLEACDLPITDNGYFLAYKKVNNDFTDIYSGKFDNRVGSRVEIPRNMVDEDSTRTCSRGLHVCSRSYLTHFGSRPNNKVILVKIHPKDVVAVPADYQNAKMRVCSYEVVDDISDQFYDGEKLTPSFYTGEYGGNSDLADVIDDIFDDNDSFVDLDDDSESDQVSDNDESAPKSRVTHGKLNEHQVREIRRLLEDGGWLIAGIAKVYGVDESTIRKIRDGVTWAWLT